MKYVRTADIALSVIEVPERLRPVDDAWAEAIAESMARDGQQTPIEVVEQLRGPKYRLVAGGHRVAAARRLELPTIRAEIKRTENQDTTRELELQLAEIDENLFRNELTALNRAIHIGRRQELYEALYPETKRGGKRAETGQFDRSDIMSFRCATAEKIGLSERTIERDTRIYKAVKGLPDELQALLHKSEIARSVKDLYLLTRESPEHRVGIVTLALRHREHGIGGARAMFHGKVVAARPQHEIDAAKLRDAWERSGRKAKRRHLEYLQKIGVITDFVLDHVGGPE